MPQASERSLATPMIRPRLPAISPFVVVIGAAPRCFRGRTARCHLSYTSRPPRPIEATGGLAAMLATASPACRLRSMRDADKKGQNGRMETIRDRVSTAAAFVRYMLERFNRDRCFAAAGALSYTALVSLVPLGVIALGILSIFP